MSAEDFDGALIRAGRLDCVCGPGVASGEVGAERPYALAAGFGLSVLAQALVLSALPEASRLLAPGVRQIGWPFALLLVGAAAATIPAAMLIDAFGRRAAVGLGAGLGVAGGLLAAHGIAHAQFAALCLGAFWLGLAQGFALFYRHIAAGGLALAARGGLFVFGGGAGAALAAPLAAAIIAAFGGGAGATLIGAAALHVAALGLSVRLPHALAPEYAAQLLAGSLSRSFYAATLAGAAAWFVMAAGMLHGPLTLAVCSAGPSFVGGAMAWHLLAMYGPAALAARWPVLAAPRLGPPVGLALLFAGASGVAWGASAALVAAALLAIGAGWSLVNASALRLLHGGAPPPRLALALHDLCLLGAAAAGALAF